MTLEEAVKEFEAQFAKVTDGEKSALAPNGNPYLIVSLEGLHPHAGRYVRAPTEEVAVQMWLEKAKKIAAGASVLYWRVRPEIEKEYLRPCQADGTPIPIPDGDGFKEIYIGEFWKLYSRMAFGDCMDAYRLIHTLDEITGNCTACGATREAMQDCLAKTCAPDGQPHSRVPAVFDEVGP